jgi:RNA polymerase sigma-70 factor (ECF subfamily)
MPAARCNDLVAERTVVVTLLRHRAIGVLRKTTTGMSAHSHALPCEQRDALEALVKRHAPRLRTLARRMLRNEQDAEDAVQEAFLRLLRASMSFESDARASAWLAKVTRNLARMCLRSRRRRPEHALDECAHALDRNQSAWPDTLAVQRQERVLLRSSLANMPEGYRRVLVMSDLDAMETSDVSRALGVTANLVKVRLHRARRALRRDLQARCSPPRALAP